MFFSPDQIANSIAALANVHPFHGITFLACKKAELPIGRAVDFPMDSKTAEFMRQYHKIDPDSAHFFQPYSVRPMWVRSDYPSSGLQAVNTQTFAKAFLHERHTRIWGWVLNYVSVLEARLKTRRRQAIRIPVFHISVWLYKDKEWPSGTSIEDVINLFFEDFHITEDEKKALFDPNTSTELFPDNTFQVERTSWSDWRQFIPQPPDSKPDQGGTLTYLETRGVGPAERFILAPSDRLTLITGDNGLGKTFLLECSWWALTGFWADRPAYPNPGTQNNKVEITFVIEGERSRAERKTISFDWKTQTWPHPKNRPTIPGLIVYARVDGSFAVWDPAKQAIRLDPSKGNDKSVFTSGEVWDGLQGQIEGLIRDWVTWQNNPERYPFDSFIQVLDSLSPPDLGTLKPGQPVRIPDDPREIPTIIHPYGATPIVYASAGVRRVITLAYLVTTNLFAPSKGDCDMKHLVVF